MTQAETIIFIFNINYKNWADFFIPKIVEFHYHISMLMFTKH